MSLSKDNHVKEGRNEEDKTVEMRHQEIAPCGIDCSRCVSFKGGVVRHHSTELLDSLKGFERKVPFFSSMVPDFQFYDPFIKILKFFSQASCRGCRSGECINSGCRINSCLHLKEVSFCFECCKFPCSESGLTGELKQRWIDNNLMIKNNGFDAFYRQSKSLPRY